MRKIKSLFTKEVVTLAPSASITDAARLMDENKVGAVVVVEQERPVGIVTDRDLAMALAVRGHSKDESVQEVMTCPVTSMHDDEGIFEATQYMMDNAFRRVPVVNRSGRLVGLVTLDDLLVLLSRELEYLAKGVREETAAGPARMR
jgi:signal-transduction protein with cAMP-binding, CBS, and nucleotidyltransferase domain